ncbi:MAG TPA: AGE family epimerase/isomerase [Terriglobales bacterium]|nr:AGE family epimerase/isomerase [Terriglobales bacterium]
MKNVLLIAAAVLVLCPHPAFSAAESSSRSHKAASRQDYLRLADEVEAMLREDVLDAWFPRAIDGQNGGFTSTFSRDWKPGRSQGKFSVFQGRMTWISAEAAMRRPELKERFAAIAERGVEFLTNVLWDKKYGGFFWGVDDRGEISPLYTDGKELYGESFAIYGAAAAYQGTHDPKALALAQNGFRWIDEHAHDARNGGYFEWLTREGKAVQDDGGVSAKTVPAGGFLIGYKSMNTHIHLLEALSQLYEVWKDPIVRQRLEELLELVRDRICVQPGVMNLFFTNDWRPIPGHDSYGHDVETAYLMLEAEDVLGKAHDPKTERMARMLVDHALAYGWDDRMGGFYGEGTTFGKAENLQKDWWVQMEGLNSLLLMHEKYGDETDLYFKKFLKQWDFIKNYQRDRQYHGIYPSIGADGIPVSTEKGQIWKAAYHDGRALLNVSERLRRLAARNGGGTQ